jgi:hypothetical protein
MKRAEFERMDTDDLWSLRPRWLVAQLKSGGRIEDFRIEVRNKRQTSKGRAQSSRRRVDQ